MDEPIGLTMARWVVSNGGHVMPCYINKDLDKFPLVKGGVNAATRDIRTIETWWAERGYACVGVASRVDGWICFDADGPAAREWLHKLVIDTGGVGEGLYYETPGRTGGAHLWYSWPSWLSPIHSAKVRGSVGEVQLRGIGCFSLLPCNRRDGEYKMLNVPENGLSDLSRELYLAFAKVAEQTTVAVTGDLREISVEQAFSQTWSENRKNCLAGLLWNVLIRGMDSDEALELVNRWNRECCQPPLEENIIRRKWEYTVGRATAARDKIADESAQYSNWMKIG